MICTMALTVANENLLYLSTRADRILSFVSRLRATIIHMLLRSTSGDLPPFI